jgi:hypothetical protein
VDENFDAEFMDMAGSDFFNEVDESVGQTTGGDQGGKGYTGGCVLGDEQFREFRRIIVDISQS